MEFELSTKDKLQIIDDLLKTILYYSQIRDLKFYNITLEEQLVNGIGVHSGKAFSTDGSNIFGFTVNDIDPEKRISRIFAGTYVEGKGVTLYAVPIEKFFIQENIMDIDIDATNRPGHTKMHGRFWRACARVGITPENSGNLYESHIQPFINSCNLWKDMDEKFTERFLLMTTKAYQQEMNKSLIDKFSEFAKDIPIPPCFADDGADPKTKI